MTIMSKIITEEDIWNKLQNTVQQFVHIQFYRTNLVNPGRMGTIKITLNIIGKAPKRALSWLKG